MKGLLLLVEDDQNAREGMRAALEEEGYQVIGKEDAQGAIEILKREKVDLLITDLRLPGMDGLSLLKKTQEVSPATLIIIITAYATVENAVEAMKEGAYDYVTKPINLDRFLLLIKRAVAEKKQREEYQILREKYETLKRQVEERHSFESLIGASHKMREIFQTILQIAPTRVPVLIQGESGTGKELIARALHARSNRKDKPFIAVHCAALATTLLESELFGHEKGAFTGAVESKPGRFELANHGTLFLDEVSEIDPAVQVKLLRVLQEQEFERVGGVKTIKVDVRVISATNVRLEEKVKEGKFREDLYYRLKVITLNIPPLRERKEDIPLLVHAFIKEANEANKKKIKGITSRALTFLINYSWPGNVRELKNVIESMVVLAKKDIISAADIPIYIKEELESKEAVVPVKLEGSWAEIEKTLIFAALRYAEGNKSRAADLLGLSRRTLYRKLKELEIAG
ncbi:MAG: sigma-54-dependent Fis family transcriptional regulator [Caldiserica bacterium]|nr:sigma-54-dependent Fis family transcriptional regulator [Caldisericota bacterium]